MGKLKTKPSEHFIGWGVLLLILFGGFKLINYLNDKNRESSCNNSPKYSYNDKIIYPLIPFYKHICSGRGTIIEYHRKKDCSINYTVYPDEEPCLRHNNYELTFDENDIKLEKK